MYFVPHCSFFIRNDVINKISYYDIHYKYASDFDFILRCLTSINVRYRLFITVFRRHVDSLTSSGIPRERNEIINKYISTYKIKGFYKLVIWFYLWFKYYSKNTYYNIKKNYN